ncbi:MAG: PepSY-associated TM helix domain-containing protein [Acidobacteriota bacterium]
MSKKVGPFGISKRQYKLHYDLHSWTGIVAGLVIFVVCLSGSVAIVEHELATWEQPELRLEPASNPQPIGDLVALAMAEVDPRARAEPSPAPGEEGGEEAQRTDSRVFLELPSESHPTLSASFFEDGKWHYKHWDPANGEQIEVGESALSFHTGLHTHLQLPVIGRMLVGFAGLFLMISIISGVAAHPQLVREIFLLRWRPSLRMSFSDLHKQVGTWSLLFGGMLSFTGALLGLFTLFAPVMVLSAFGGDLDKAVEAFSGKSQEFVGETADMLPIGPLVEDFEAQHPGYEVSRLVLTHYGDQAAEITLDLAEAPQRTLDAPESHRLSLVTGETLYVQTFNGRGIGARLMSLTSLLHFGTFGGGFLKLLYFVSGLLLTLCVGSGLYLWLERRRRERADLRSFQILERLILGVCIGQVLATCVSIGAARVSGLQAATVFFAVWVGYVALLFAVPRLRFMVRAGGLASAAALGGIAAYDLVTADFWFVRSLPVDASLLVLAVLLAACFAFVPARKSTRVSSEPSRDLTRAA